MRTALRIVAGLLLALGVLLCLIGLSTLPDGGLMFALPYVFLMPGLLLCAVGGLGLWLARTPRDTSEVP
jgi:hypothetical protein